MIVENCCYNTLNYCIMFTNTKKNFHGKELSRNCLIIAVPNVFVVFITDYL